MKPEHPGDGNRKSSNREVDVFTALLAILDFVDNEMPKLGSIAELKAALVIWRQTHGWGKLTDAIGARQLAKLAGMDEKVIRRALSGHKRGGGRDKSLAEKIGIISQQGIDPAGDLARTRYTWPINERVRARFEKATESKAGEADGGRVQDTPTPGVQMHPTGGVQNTPTQSCINQSCSSHLVKATKADSQPTNRKTGDSPAVGRPHVAEQPKTELPKADLPARAAGSKPLPVEKQTAEPAYRGDWSDEELAAAEDFLSDHMPEVLEEWEQNGNVPDWLPQATLDAGLGATPEEVLMFVLTEIDSGWNPPNWKSYPAAVRHEFERRQNRARGKRWSDSDLATLRAGLQKYMEGDEPPERFEHSCELRANGATAREVFDLIERKWRNKKYRPGGQLGPRGWNWFLKVIGNEFSATERSHLPEPPAAPHPEHQATAEEMARGIDVLDSLVASYTCKCGAEIRQYSDRVVGTCTCGRAKPITRATITQMPIPGEGKRRLSGGGRQ